MRPPRLARALNTEPDDFKSRIQYLMRQIASHLSALEAESIHLLREVAAEFERPVLLFSGGKDSVVMAHTAAKAFWPARLPFPVMHVDTGHNFPEVIAFRDEAVERLGARLVVASVQESIDQGRVVEDTRGRRVAQPPPDRRRCSTRSKSTGSTP